MASPEQPNFDNFPVLTLTNLTSALADVDRRLELNDENENTIERTMRREQILEERDELQAEIDLFSPPLETP